MATNPANIYCAADDMRDILSRAGVNLAKDDFPPSNFGRAIEKAGNQIDKYLYRRYDPSQLALSDLVRDWAAVIACYFLRTRRGEPPPQGLQLLYEEAIADLKEIRAGQNDVPGISPRCTSAPGMSVKKSTLRPYPRATVETSMGTKAAGLPPNPHQHKDAWDQFGANNPTYLDFSI